VLDQSRVVVKHCGHILAGERVGRVRDEQACLCMWLVVFPHSRIAQLRHHSNAESSTHLPYRPHRRQRRHLMVSDMRLTGHEAGRTGGEQRERRGPNHVDLSSSRPPAAIAARTRLYSHLISRFAGVADMTGVRGCHQEVRERGIEWEDGGLETRRGS
jgi:hypothetical protein